jgi:hypothetical protein
VNAGLGEVRAAGQGVEDLELLSGKIRIVHGANFRLHDSARVGQGQGGRKVGIGCRSMKRWEQEIYRKSVTVKRPIGERAGWDSFSAWILILRSEGGAAESMALAAWRFRGKPLHP